MSEIKRTIGPYPYKVWAVGDSWRIELWPNTTLSVFCDEDLDIMVRTE